jgi:hypothetical protein
MIRYALVCGRGHSFEAWFGSSHAYDEQAEAHAVACPDCGSTEVSKAPMAPYVAKCPAEAPGPKPAERRKTYAMLRQIREEMTANSDYVGEKFPEEARKIHFDEVPPRSIHGEATLEEAKALTEEGIAVRPLPPLPEDEN